MAESKIKKSPKWKGRENITIPFTAPANGLVVLIIQPQSANTSYYYVKGSSTNSAVARGNSQNGTDYTLSFPVIKGETYSVDASSNATVGYGHYYQLA